MSEEIIHYGIKGMKWGRRKDKGSSSADAVKSTDDNSSDDAKAAAAAKTKAKTTGLSSLSNKELQTLNERMNLEANYTRLTSQGTPEKSAVDKGLAVYNGLKKTADIANEVYRTYNSPAVKMIRESIVKKL